MKNKRLEAVCSFLSPEDFLIDIGCDHGYVAIEQAKKGAKKILATDIHASALNVAFENIKKNNLEKTIELLQTDGLENIEVDLYNTLVIAGMGTSTIIHILKKEKLKCIKKIILQSNNDLEELRRFMNDLDYCLKEEKVIFEKKHYYVIMKYEKGKQTLTKEELLFGLYKKENKEYYEYLLKNYNQIIKKIPWYKWKNKKKLKEKKKLLKKYL